MAKILIVDDSQDLCEVLSVMVQRKGHTVTAAYSKKDLFRQLPIVTPDLLLLDVRLGGEDGRKVCKEIKASFPGLPVILLSGSSDLLQNYEECMADDVVEKPFDMNSLLIKIDALVNKSQSVGGQ